MDKYSERKELEWKELKSEHVIQDEWIDVRRLKYQMPDGSVFEPYYSYSRRDYVVIVATDEKGDYLCVRQFRQGIKTVTTEFPAGGIERSGKTEYRSSEEIDTTADNNNDQKKDPKNITDKESALEAAKRELREETGYTSDKWTHLLTIPSNATIADNYAYIFKAENCCHTREQQLDATEFLNVEKYTERELEELINTGRFQQAVHVLAYLLSKKSKETL